MIDIPFPENSNSTWSVEEVNNWLREHFPDRPNYGKRHVYWRPVIVAPSNSDCEWRIRCYDDEDATLFGLLWQG